MHAFVEKNCIIPDIQYGFRGGVSTGNQLIDLIYDISNAFNDKKLICVDLVFLDYSSAFDTVNHSILFNELYNFGIRGNALEVLKIYILIENK